MSEVQWTILPDPDIAAASAAEDIVRILSDALASEGRASVALTGGQTAHDLYRHLTTRLMNHELPLGQIDFFVGDERAVPLDDEQSNFHHARRLLLDPLGIPAGCVHPMPADATDLDQAADEYELTLRRVLTEVNDDNVPVFDLILLGLGDDGHTASLFPGTDALNETDRLVCPGFGPPPTVQRLTFTLPLISAARNIIMLSVGSSKAQAVSDVFGKQDEKFPAARIKPAGRMHVYLDKDAGRLL